MQTKIKCECPVCHHMQHPQYKTIEHYYQDQYYFFQFAIDVPCCEQCGAPMEDERTKQLIQTKAQKMIQKHLEDTIKLQNEALQTMHEKIKASEALINKYEQTLYDYELYLDHFEEILKKYQIQEQMKQTNV